MQPNIPSEIPQSSIEGTLFELTARGKKDTFFVNDDPSSTYMANPRYNPCIPFLEERRTIVPLNSQQFGGSFEIEIDSYGDVLTYCSLLISLPSWIPPLPIVNGGEFTDPSIVNNLYWITDLSGISYGYCKNIGYMLFENIQVYQDQILIQEWSGDGLFVEQSTEGSWNSSNLDTQLSGGSEPAGFNVDRLLAQRATPSLLRINIPLPGLNLAGGVDSENGGFPLCSMPGQTFRIKCKLRKLENLVQSSHSSSLAIKPTPWNTVFKYNIQNTITNTMSTTEYQFTSLQKSLIGQPTILLETSQAYLPPDIRQKIQYTPKWIIPFRQQYQNSFTIGPNDYKSFDSDNIPAITRRLDSRHITERLQWFFRTKDAIYMNRLSDFTDPSGFADDTIGMEGNGREFYNQIKLVIAGKDREHLFGPAVWRNITSFAKDEIDTGYLFGEMRWNLGDLWEKERPVSKLPEGGVNFTTAFRPTLYIQLADIPVSISTGMKEAELHVLCEAWNMYVIENGRGRMMFAN